MKGLIALGLAVLVGGTVFAAPPDQERTDKFQAKLWSVDAASGKVLVIQGDFTKSGGRGNEGAPTPQPNNPARRLIVQTNADTHIHYQGSDQHLSLADLRQLNLKQIEVPMTINCKNRDENSCLATEIILQKDDSNNNNTPQ